MKRKKEEGRKRGKESNWKEVKEEKEKRKG